MYSTLWIQSLNEIKHPNDSPGQKLLSELSIKMCTIEILHTLLSDCKLYNILSIISDPGMIIFIVTYLFEKLQTYYFLNTNALRTFEHYYASNRGISN